MEIVLLILSTLFQLFTSQNNHPTVKQKPAILPAQAESAIVTQVIDGDTIEINNSIKVRYIGINTPELTSGQCYAKEAKAYNASLVKDKTVYLVKDISDEDAYGRKLRYVYTEDGTLLNKRLLELGFAKTLSREPNTSYADQFSLVEQHAKQKSLGLWGNCEQNQTKPRQTPPDGCNIKGNINRSSVKVYHLPHCPDYAHTLIDTSNDEQWFCTEQEAQQKGFRKAKNCN